MIYTINYTKENNFIKDPKIVSKDEKGIPINESSYDRKSVPDATTEFTPTYKLKNRRYLVDIEQSELDDLVKEMHVYDENGQKIEEAPLRALNAPFWKSEHATISIPTSGISLDDEVPQDKFWLAVFRAEPNFRFSDDNLPPSKLSMVEYTVTKLGNENFEQEESQDATFEAMKYLTGMSDNPKKMKMILRAMGTDLRNPTDDTVRRALQKKITYLKDEYVRGTSETNIDMFMRLAKQDTATYEIKSQITRARTLGIITKKANGNYFFGDIKLGGSIQKVEDYLKDEENSDVLMEITQRIKKNSEDED